jgi:eukaryotic-like serine/threonine-protein kinase
MGRNSVPGPGSLVGRKYELCEIAGRGGMATVWRGVLRGDSGFFRPVAVKQMHEHLADQQLYQDMFLEEARVGAELHDPNIAHVYDYVAERGQHYIIMEWVEGIDLGTFVRYHLDRGARTRWDVVAAVGIGVLRGLAAAHERVDRDGEPAPVVHRDISPHNILLTDKGQVKLIDFGLSLARDRRKETTEPGVVKGKMSYLSPEIVMGARPSPLSDQFATGSVLWEALVGRKLFDGPTDLDVYAKLREGQVQPLRPQRPDVPAKLATTLQRALAPADKKRYPSAREMARQLATVLKGSKARKDLHTILGATVIEARATMGMDHRTGDPSSTTPVADLPGTVEPVGDQRRKLRHRLPFFGRKR